jgi:hypothetical protein
MFFGAHAHCNFLVIDGHSTDGSYGYASSFAREHSNVEVLQRAPNGVYDAMNFAVNNVTTEFVMFINSGDVLLTNPNFILDQLTRLAIDPSIKALSFKCANFFTERSTRYYSNSNATIPHQGLVYQVTLHETLGLYDPSYNTISDRLFISAVPNYNLLIVDKYLSATLVSPENRSRRPGLLSQDMKRIKGTQHNYTPFPWYKLLVYQLEKVVGFSFSSYFKAIIFEKIVHAN